MPLLLPISGNKPVKVSLSKKKIKWDEESCSKFQTSVKLFLKQYWQFDIGVCEELIIPKSLLRIDILNFQRKIAIETSGQQHFEYTPFFHGNNPLNYMQSIKRDDKKRIWLERNGFTLLEFLESDVPHLSPKYIKDKFGVDII